MALHTLEELHDKTADQIRALIEEGYRISPKDSYSDKNDSVRYPNVFHTKLVKELNPSFKYEVVITSADGVEGFCKSLTYKDSMGTNNKYDWKYYKVHDNIYADTEEEADREHKKWLAFNLGLGDIDGKDPVQVFADMLGNHICKCLRRGK